MLSGFACSRARFLSTAANHNPNTARPTTCRSALQEGVWMAAQSQQSYMLRSCSSSLENLEQWPLGLGGKMFLLLLSEDVVKSQPRSSGLHL